MHQMDVGIGVLKSLHSGGSAMGGAVIHDPKDSLGTFVGLLLHDLLDQPAKRLDTGRAFTSAKNLGSSYIPSG